MFYYPGKYYDLLFNPTPRRFSKTRYVFKSFFVSEKDFVKDLPFFFKDFHLKFKRFLDKSFALPAKNFSSLNKYNNYLLKNFLIFVLFYCKYLFKKLDHHYLKKIETSFVQASSLVSLSLFNFNTFYFIL